MTRNDTIITKMEHVEESLKDTLYRVEVIERKLKTKLLTTENREKLENELEEVKEVLRRNEKELQNLRKENSKSFMITACLIFREVERNLESALGNSWNLKPAHWRLYVQQNVYIKLHGSH